jgi:membrane protease YdiL (CAAX protease family)
MGLLWALVTYAAGDLTYWAFQLVSPGAEPAPASLVKSLTGPLDTVLYTFVIVGLLEEFVFRRGVFKPLLARLEKFKLSPRAALGWALVLSSLFFSWAHYVDWGAIMIKLGFMDPASSGLAGTYAWSWAGFMARAVCGVVLAYQYWRSGLLMVPIVAHFAANTMEGLGLRWGFEAFLAMAAALLAVQFLGKSSRNSGSTQRS